VEKKAVSMTGERLMVELVATTKPLCLLHSELLDELLDSM
jgi:hypothetical protein